MPLDIASGILVAALVSHFFQIPFNASLIFWGVIFNLLPDFDVFILSLNRGLKKTTEPTSTGNILYHRDLFHKPIYFLVISMLLLLFSKQFAMLFFLGTFFHLIHDSIAVGWGIQWLWPISKNHTAFFHVNGPPNKPLPNQLFYNWTRQQISKIAVEYHDPNWIKNVYFRWNWVGATEYISLIIAVYFAYTLYGKIL